MFNFFSKPNNNISPSNLNLTDNQKKFEVIINTIEDGVVLIDNKETIQLFNPSAEKITGWKATDATGINIFSVIKLIDNKNQPYNDSINPIKKVFLTGQTLRDNNANLITTSNNTIPITISVSPILDANNQVSAAVVGFRNVSTERAEEQRRADFISTASHEMRTPVAAIEGYISLALNDKVATIDNRARGYLEKAHSSTQHLGKLFQDLLTSAKAEDGRLISHPVIIEMGSFIEQLTDDLRFVADKKNLLTNFTVGSTKNIDASNGNLTAEHQVKPLYYILADPDRISEVITNLFDNAVKYTAQGKITLGITGNNEIVQFYIKDTGSGIPVEDIPHLFQKFYRVDNSSTRTIGGTGLGLFISKKIVELYQGRIWVESELNKGTTFFINFPRISSEKAANIKNNLIIPQ